MKRRCTYLKKTSSMVLVVMLLLSMMSGVLTLSASADDSTLPVLLNEPILTYTYDSDRYPYRDYPTPVVLNFDNSASEGSGNDLLDIVSIDFDERYSDGCVAAGTWYNFMEETPMYADSSRTYGSYYYDYWYGYNNNLQYHNTGSSGYSSFYVIEDFSTVIINPRCNVYTSYNNRNQIMTYLNFTINYANGTSQNVPVSIMPMEDYLDLEWGTATAMALSLAHSTTIDDEDFYELENAIYNVKGQYDNTTNRYYINIESEDDVVLPMNHMSSNAYLVQTRVGENVVYNTAQSVDFGENSVSAYPEGADYGKVYTLPDGSYMSEEDIHNVYKYFLSEGSLLYKYNGNVYGTDSWYYVRDYIGSYPHYLKMAPENYYRCGYPNDLDFLENGYVATDLYTGIPGTHFDQEVINDSIAQLAESIQGNSYDRDFWGMYHYDSPAYYIFNPRWANIQFKDNSSVTSLEIVTALQNFAQADTTSAAAKSMLTGYYNGGLYFGYGSNYTSGI